MALITPLTCSNPNPGVDKSVLTLSDMKTLSKYWRYTGALPKNWARLGHVICLGL